MNMSISHSPLNLKSAQGLLVTPLAVLLQVMFLVATYSTIIKIVTIKFIATCIIVFGLGVVYKY